MPLRHAIFLTLVALPLALLTWMAVLGRDPPPELEAALPARDGGTAADPDAALRALFAAPLAGASPGDGVVLYDADGLFEYINGAAPLYLERGFRRLAAAEMNTADGGELTLDVYDMQTPGSARAIFEKERSPTARSVEGWPESAAGPMSFVFSAGAYYVKLTAFDAAAEAQLPAIARSLEERIR